ncbi:MAG: polyprenol phosphomannose-dependent alpha 1,6 mannosyltransferase MptB [Propionicimonas sp.]|nr:polyprenol phosphomannose-dependent alpha 1,6 mannosyltransferase MptB [Propionicimonas sp.]
MALIAASAATTIAVGFAGPSAVALDLGERTSWLPPWYLPASAGTPNEYLAVGLLWLGLLVGTIGLWIAWRAVREGWRPDNRKLFGLGAGLSVLTALVPPLTSADVLMYAAYGRLQVLGLDPYDITPAMIFREEFDPVLILTERPWQDTPSVYGPMASFSQWLAAWLGGESMHDIVFWLQVLAVVPFLAIGLIVYRMAREDRATQTRAVLFTVLNPLMIWSVVAGAHNEALPLVFAVAGLWLLRRHPLLAGIGIGLAGTVKVSLVFYGLAMVWGYRREPRKLVWLVVGAAIPLAVAYGVLVPRALFAASRNTGYISAGSWAPWFHGLFSLVMPEWIARSAVGWMGWIGMVVIAWMLSRVLPWQAVPGADPLANPRREPLTVATRTAVILTAAWLITSPYTLSWYDLTTWVPLGLLAASRLDGLMMWRGMWLSVAYVTGRSVEFSPGLQTAAAVVRDGLCSAAQLLVIVLIVRWWWTEGRELPSFTRLRASLAMAGDSQRIPYD